MIKAFEIALKDMKQSFRSLTALIFMFGVPILMTVMFVFLFGGTGSEEDAFAMPVVEIQVVNLDQSEIELGVILVDILQGENLSDLLIVTIAEDVELARQAVDERVAAVAVIIPENFSTSLLGTDELAEVEIYSDPSLTLGPGIVQNIIDQSLDNFIDRNFSTTVVIEQLLHSGLAIDQAQIAQLIEESQGYVENNFVSIQNTSGDDEVSSGMGGFIQMIMVSMMLFYAFYTGASTILSVLTEEEMGTLPRLFTTPTPQRIILTGKFLASFITVFIQMVVLLSFGALVFGFSWGPTLQLLFVVICISIASSCFGIFIISLLENRKQAGVALGAGVTLTGMIGMSKVFTLSIPNPPPAVNIIPRFVPQGWALDALQTVMEGGSNQELFLTTAVLLIWSAVFFFIGNRRFTRRYF